MPETLPPVLAPAVDTRDLPLDPPPLGTTPPVPAFVQNTSGEQSSSTSAVSAGISEPTAAEPPVTSAQAIAGNPSTQSIKVFGAPAPKASSKSVEPPTASSSTCMFLLFPLEHCHALCSISSKLRRLIGP